MAVCASTEQYIMCGSGLISLSAMEGGGMYGQLICVYLSVMYFMWSCVTNLNSYCAWMGNFYLMEAMFQILLS
jgi:hypothetical protein